MKSIIQLVLMMALMIPIASHAQSRELCSRRPDLCGKKKLKAKKAKTKKHIRAHRNTDAFMNLDHYVQQNAADPALKQKVDTQQAFVEPKRLPLPEKQGSTNDAKDAPLIADTPADKPADTPSTDSSGDRAPASSSYPNQ